MKPIGASSLVVGPTLYQRSPKDFKIIVPGISGASHDIHLSALVTASGYVRNLLLCDPTVRWINFPISDPNDFLKHIVKYFYGDELIINKENLGFVRLAADFFQDPSLHEAIRAYVENFGTFNDILDALLAANDPVQVVGEINIVVNRFAEFEDNEKMFKLKLEIYDEILRRCSKSVRDIHVLFDWIRKIVEIRGNEFVQLFANLFFEKLEPDEVHYIRTAIPSEMVGGAFWKCVCKRLLCRMHGEEKKVRKNKK